MKLIKMRYKGISFDANPSSIEISMEKNISKRNIPFYSSKVQEVNFLPQKITGKGRLTGEDAREKAHQLEVAFKSNGSDYLFVPNAAPIKSFFKALSMSYDSKDNSIIFSFEFVEDSKYKKDEFVLEYVYPLEDETIYDISRRTGVSVEKILELNDIPNILAPKMEEKIWLR